MTHHGNCSGCVKPEFRHELIALLNRHSMDCKTSTADWILADYLINAMRIFGIAVEAREVNRGPEFNKNTIEINADKDCDSK